MKKTTLVIVLFLMTLSSLQAQVYTLPDCGSNSGSTFFGPMYSSSLANSTSRTAIIYPSAAVGNISGQVITGLYFKRLATTGPMNGTPNFKIYIKETAAVDFGTAAIDWATSITGATLVYDSNPASSVGSDAGWKLFPLATNFTYSGTQNLAIFFEYNNPITSNGIAWYIENNAPCVDTGNLNTTKYATNTTGTLPTSLTSSNYRRPLIGFDFSVSCNAPLSVSTESITTNSANVSWEAPTVLPTNGYEYYLSTSFASPLPSTTPTDVVPTGTTIALSSLLPNINYYLWVRSVCDASNKSIWREAVPFKTLCTTITEYTQNFEGFSTGATSPMPDCWYRGGSGGASYITNGSVAPMSPSNRLTMIGNGTPSALAETYVVLPAVSNLQANTHQLKFKAFATAADRTLDIGYMTDVSNMSSFVILQQITLPGTTPSAALEFEFTPLPGAVPAGVINLAIRNSGVSTGTTYAFLDDFVWEAIPSCIGPTALTATAMTFSSAMLGWTEAATATAWEIQYGAPGFVIGTGTTVSAPTNPFELTGLSANTNYVYYVRAVCPSSDSSPWMGPFAFKTLCDDLTAYTQNFEGYATGFGSPMPDCWARGGTGTTYIIFGSSPPMSIINKLYMYASGTVASQTEAYAILPSVVNLQANTHRLKFKAYSTDLDRNLDVGYLTNSNDVNSFVFLQQISLPGTAATTATIFQIIPGALPAGVKNLAIRNSGYPGGSTTAFLDDFVWEAIPTCMEPTGFGVSNVLDTSAELSWMEGGAATAWQIEYGAPGFVQGTGTIVPAPSNPFLLAGLSPNTNYVCYVRAICSGSDNSQWTGPLAFKTRCTPVTEFAQNFEGYLTGSSAPMPDCWAKAGTASSTYIASGSVAPMSPANRLYMFANLATAESYAIMPTVSNLQANTHHLKFKAFATSLDRFLEVGYLTDPSNVSTFQLIEEVNLPGSTATAALEFTVVPGVLPVTAKCLVIKNPGFPGGSSTIYIDDVSWGVIEDLNTGSFDSANFNFYPNPVTDVLTISYSNVISEVVVFNLLGQKVVITQPKATQSQVDLSGLTAGTYLVKVTSDEVTKTIKVVKN